MIDSCNGDKTMKCLNLIKWVRYLTKRQEKVILSIFWREPSYVREQLMPERVNRCLEESVDAWGCRLLPEGNLDLIAPLATLPLATSPLILQVFHFQVSQYTHSALMQLWERKHWIHEDKAANKQISMNRSNPGKPHSARPDHNSE